MEEYLVYILSPTFAVIGFIIRFIWDFYINRRKRVLTEKINTIEYRLHDFYYPIYFRLKRERIIWEKIIKLFSSVQSVPSSVPAIRLFTPEMKLSREFRIHMSEPIIKALDDENLKIHREIQGIIHEGISKAVPSEDLIRILMQYDEHVTVYHILRHIGLKDKFPCQYGAPFPSNIMETLGRRITELQNDHKRYTKKLG